MMVRQGWKEQKGNLISGQQRKEKHTADTLKFAKRDPPKCPKFKRGMYKVKYNNIKENGSVNPGSFEEDWFSDGDATLEKLS